jgi:membrane-associated protein
MINLSITNFSDYSLHLGYLGIFLFFITIDQFTPIPEEITLLTIGYLSFNHVFNPVLAGIVSLMAFITVDMLYFFLTKSGNKLVKRLTERKSSLMMRYREKLEKHFGLTLFLLCFIPRMRLLGPVFAGVMNVPFKKFVLFDLLGLSIFTSVYILLGMVFHQSLHMYLAHTETLKYIIFISSMIFLTVLIVVFIRKMSAK